MIETGKRASPEMQRVMRQRVIAEMLEKAAEEASKDGRVRDMFELREQAAEARRVADDAFRDLCVP